MSLYLISGVKGIAVAVSQIVAGVSILYCAPKVFVGLEDSDKKTSGESSK